MTLVVRDGRQAMGKVPLWKQWAKIIVGLLLTPVFVILTARFIGWPLLRRFWSSSCPPAEAGALSLGSRWLSQVSPDEFFRQLDHRGHVAEADLLPPAWSG
jgi:hypothetical protein